MVKAQQWLEENYPKNGVCIWEDSKKDEDENDEPLRDSSWNNKGKRREEIEKLHFPEKDDTPLEGDLKLEGFTKLKTLDFLENEITSLEIVDSPGLEVIFIRRNKITELDTSGFPNLELLDCIETLLSELDLSKNNKLKVLRIPDNNFSKQDLSFLSHLVNLKSLEIGNIKESVERGIYNRFYGSLEHLKKMTELEVLDIENTDIDSGLEYLSNKIRSFTCSSDESRNFKVKEIEKQLKEEGEPDKNDDFYLLLAKWKVGRLDEELRIEREEVKKFHEKSEEYSLKNLEEVAKDLGIDEKEWKGKIFAEIKMAIKEEVEKIRTNKVKNNPNASFNLLSGEGKVLMVNPTN